jgi:hypothetical protein
MSLTKAKYMVTSQATLQAMWLSSLFESIGVYIDKTHYHI